MGKAVANAATIALILFASLLVIPATTLLPSDYVAYTGFEPPSQCPSSEGYAPNIWEDGNWTTYMLMRRGSTQNRIVQSFADAGQTMQPKSGDHCLEMHFNQSEGQWNGTETRDSAHSRLTVHLVNPPFPHYYQSAWYYIPRNWNMSNTEGNETGTDRAWWEFISYKEENRSSPPAPVPGAYRFGGITIGQDSPWNGSQDMFWEVKWGWSFGNDTERDRSFSYHIEPNDFWGSKATTDSLVRCNPHEVPTGRWFRMEFYLYRHETNGIMSLWITDPDNDNASRRETRLLFEIRGEKTFEYRDQTPDEGGNIAKMYMTRNQTQFPTHLWVDEVYVFNYNARAPIGDANGDDIVDLLDLTIVGEALGSGPEHPEWNPMVDLNSDGIVDLFDLTRVGKDLGKTTRVFCDGFESGGFGAFTGISTRGDGVLECQSSVKRFGWYAEHAYAVGSAGTDRAFAYFDTPHMLSDAHFVRMYMRFVNLPDTHGAYANFVSVRDADPYSALIWRVDLSYIADRHYLEMATPHGSSSYLYHDFSDLDPTEWYVVEFGYRKHATQGFYRIYVNGVLAASDENRDTSSDPDAVGFRFGLVGGDGTWGSGLPNFYMDLVAVDTEYIGPVEPNG